MIRLSMIHVIFTNRNLSKNIKKKTMDYDCRLFFITIIFRLISTKDFLQCLDNYTDTALAKIYRTTIISWTKHVDLPCPGKAEETCYKIYAKLQVREFFSNLTSEENRQPDVSKVHSTKVHWCVRIAEQVPRMISKLVMFSYNNMEWL